MNVAQADQMDAACRDLRRRVSRLQDNPPPGGRMMQARDFAIHEALVDRLYEGIRDQSINCCCARTESPGVTYWVPRARMMLCEPHWLAIELCSCHVECDACRLSCDDGEFYYMFIGPFVVHAVLCVSCRERAGVSADGA